MDGIRTVDFGVDIGRYTVCVTSSTISLENKIRSNKQL